MLKALVHNSLHLFKSASLVVGESKSESKNLKGSTVVFKLYWLVGRCWLTEDCGLFPGAIKCSEWPAREKNLESRLYTWVENVGEIL